jgi:peptide/nickel transport system permease protein
VTAAIGSHLGTSLLLTGMASALVLLAGIPLGVLAALRAGTATDRAIVGLSVVGISAPAFVTGVLLLYVFAIVLPWFPVFGVGEGLADRFYHLVLPAIALALTTVALVVRLTRAATITALEQDYVLFARARGIPARRVLMRYALRNALVPVLTAAGLVVAVTLASAVLVEVTFGLPGLGTLLIDSVNLKDVPVVQGVVLVLAALIVVLNLVIDVLYAFANPRVRLGSGA